MRIGRRFCGPPRSGQGGVTCGMMATARDGSARSARVRLAAPPPLEADLSVKPDGAGGVTVHAGSQLIGSAGPAPTPRPVPPRVEEATARIARDHFAGHKRHPFATCFVCGTERSDGLEVFTGPVGTGLVAGTWQVPDPARSALPTAAITLECLVWAVLDCPGCWALGFADRPAVLGTMSAWLTGLPQPGEVCVAVGEARGRQGRKGFAATALYGADGRLIGSSEQVWVEVDPATFGD